MALTAALDTLPDRQKRIVNLGFYHRLSQRQTANLIRVSQMHVSRLERSALSKLRLIIQKTGSHPDSAVRMRGPTLRAVRAMPKTN